MPLLTTGIAVAAVSVGLIALFTGHDVFVPTACQGLQSYLGARLVGQELALQQLTDAVCDHLADPQPRMPLVVSSHGPPGVGKSLTHLLAATALYNTAPHPGLRCPGADCPGYKALLVIEEYDKMSCQTRGFLRQVIENSGTANVSLARSIILLESNLGFIQLYKLQQDAERSRRGVQPEVAMKVLKDLVFSIWEGERCEDFSDTRKMLGLISFFLPYFPLRREHLRSLLQLHLADKAAQMMQVAAEHRRTLAYSPEVLDFLVGKIELDGGFAVEGGREVGALITRHVSRALRLWAAQHAPPEPQVPVLMGVQPPARLAKVGRWATKAAGKLPGMLGMPRDGSMGTLRLHVQHSLPYASTLVAAEETET